MLEIFRHEYSTQRLDVTSEIVCLLMPFIFHVKYTELQIFIQGNIIDKTIRFQLILVKLGSYTFLQ